MNEISLNVLQLGNSDWRELYYISKEVDLTYKKSIRELPDRSYDVIFVDKTLSDEEVDILQKSARSYTYFVMDTVLETPAMNRLFIAKRGRKLTSDELKEFLNNELKNYYGKAYGEKFKPENIEVSRNFNGSVSWTGNYSVNLKGEFGTEYRQIIFWRYNIPVQKGQALDFWLEYDKDKDVEICLEVIEFAKGSISEVVEDVIYSGEKLQELMTFEVIDDGNLFLSVKACGVGKLSIIALHDRFSRRGHGVFIPGGKRTVTSSGEEIFYYLDLGDMKPPLAVYFSDYKTMEGFEGYNLMKKFGCPFLLVGEHRLEGGAFYLGDNEYEDSMRNIIRDALDELKFCESDLIFSGLSMGTHGALYYGADFRPHSLILGKPLCSLGTVAYNEKRIRPGGFPTSLDVLMYQTGACDDKSIGRLNDRFWMKFDKSNWNNTKFAVAYMIEDDYDSEAYQNLLAHLGQTGAYIYGKGIHGRHNDNTEAIVTWFISQYEKILTEEFNR